VPSEEGRFVALSEKMASGASMSQPEVHEHMLLGRLYYSQLQEARASLKAQQHVIAASCNDNTNSNARIAELEAKLQQWEANVRQLQQQLEEVEAQRLQTVSKLHDAEERADVATGKRMLSAMAKPAKFEGKDRLKSQKLVRDWCQQMTAFVDKAGFQGDEAVGLAESYLADEALRVWYAAKELLINPTVPDMMACLIKRFDPASNATTARVELDNLKQKGRFSKLPDYIAEFDRICSHITDMAESGREPCDIRAGLAA